MDSLKRAFGLTLMLVACSAVADDAGMIAELQENFAMAPSQACCFFRRRNGGLRSSPSTSCTRHVRSRPAR